MSSSPIRVPVVDADPEAGGTLPARLQDLEDIQIAGVAHNRNGAKAETEALEPDVLLVDLMLPGYRSIDIVRHVTEAQSATHILAMAPADPPHDRIMLAVEARALGYVCRDADASEYGAAIQQVHRGEPWLPLHQTCEVLQDGAGELAVSAEERRSRLSQVVLGLIPLTGLVAAIFLHLPHLEAGRVLGFLGLVIIVFLPALGTEVWVKGPELRTDGLHGILAPQVLGFRARPVMLYDLDERQEPLGALYLGGNADLYVLYDPCVETVRLVPVGSSRVELVDQVTCQSP